MATVAILVAPSPSPTFFLGSVLPSFLPSFLFALLPCAHDSSLVVKPPRQSTGGDGDEEEEEEEDSSDSSVSREGSSSEGEEGGEGAEGESPERRWAARKKCAYEVYPDC